jgi:pimeloyl-ACP methyl ester carboxylesterase
MVHAAGQSAFAFVLNLGAKAPAFELVDSGFDVWLANTRGNHLSRRHESLSPDDPKFWFWSVTEISKFDLPAMISYIKEETGKSKISLIGHSNGGTAVVNLLAYKPEIEHDVDVAVLWGGFSGQLSAGNLHFRFFANPIFLRIMRWCQNFLVGDFPQTTYYAKLVRSFPWIFAEIGRSRYDYTIGNDNRDHMHVYLHKLSSGTSLRSWRLIK